MKTKYGCEIKALNATVMILKYVFIGVVITLCAWGLSFIDFAPTPMYLPTVFEVQEALCEAGYEVKVDGVVGRETINAWDSFCADRFAADYMTVSGGLENGAKTLESEVNK